MRSFLLLLGLLIISQSVFAQEIPVNLKADKLKYVEGTNIIEASGSVEVRLQKVTIEADSLKMDSASNVVTAEGGVRLSAEDYQAVSDRLQYDADSGTSNLTNFKSEIFPPNIKGSLFLSAEKIEDRQGEMKGSKGEVTTCDYGLPHFYTRSAKVEYYPRDKVVGYNVFLYTGKLPVLWMPYMVYPLNTKRKRNWSFGHNEVEGYYVKSLWDYPLGTLYLDYMEKKGPAWGSAIDYNLLGLGIGSLYLYNVVNEYDTGSTDWITRINHTKKLNPYTTLRLNQSLTATYLIPSGRMDQTSLGLDLGYDHKARWNLRMNTLDDRQGSLGKQAFSFDQAYEKIATSYAFNYDQAKKDPKWIQASQNFSHSRPLWSDKVMLNLRANYNNYVAKAGDPGDERLEPAFEIAGQESQFSWRYRQNWYIDLDKDTYKGDDSYQFLEKLPEIEINPRTLDLKWFNLQSNFGYGSYHEVTYIPALGKNRDFSTQRYQAGLNANQNYDLGLATTVLVGLGLSQQQYSPGDQLYAYREDVGFQTRLPGFRNDLSFKKSTTDGNTPFVFDQLGTRYHNVQEQMTFFYQNKFDWTTSGGYNWQTHKWIDVMTALSLRPTQFFSWNINTGWDLENRLYKDLVNRLLFSPASFFKLEFSATSNLNNGEIRQGSVLYDMFFLEGEPNQWHIKFDQVFDAASKQFRVRDIMVVKDLHCWELKYTYSDYRKEFSVAIGLKAMPEEPLGMASGRGFYYEGFDRAAGQVKSEMGQEIKRY